MTPTLLNDRRWKTNSEKKFMGGEITLKIKDKGFYISIPGIPATRTPVDLDITKCDLSLVLSYLRSNGIKDFAIISRSGTEEKIYKSSDFIKKDEDKTDLPKNVEKRLDRLEGMISRLLNKSDTNDNIKNKLDFLEVLIKNIPKAEQNIKNINFSRNEPEIEELDIFIPEIDTKGLVMRGDFTENKIKKNIEGLENSVDLLSKLLNKEKSGGKK